MPKVVVSPLPSWMDCDRLLGPGRWQQEQFDLGIRATSELPREQASDVMARLRGLGFAGHPLSVEVYPRLKRNAIRDGRTRDARARRNTTPGFNRPGTRLDEEGRYSLTPESLAFWMGKKADQARVLDLTCGAGGNAIGFARAGCDVVTVDVDARRLADAQHNARVYDVENQIQFIHDDAVHHAGRHDPDIVFIDPPWGEWDHRVSTLADLPLLHTLLGHIPENPSLWMKLPPSFNTATLPFPTKTTPVFGGAKGDYSRVKFLWVRRA